MLNHLRELPPEQKRKVVIWLAFGLTIIVFIVWVVYFFDVFGTVIAGIAEKSGGAYGVFEQKIESVYNEFDKLVPSGFWKTANTVFSNLNNK